MKNPTTAALLITGLALLSAPVHAQTIDITALPSPVPGAPSATDDSLPLDLAAAYQLALARNLDLMVGRYSIAAADSGIHAASGVFDLGLGFGVDGDYTKSPSATALAGALITESRTTRFGLRLDQLLPSGTYLQLDTGLTRAETNSTFFFVNPRWNMDVNVTLRQPLLRRFGTTVNRSGIIVTRNARDRTAEAFEMMVIGTLQQVESSYWDLVAARRAVEVSQQSLDLAERLLRETQERVKVGTSAPIDLVQSEAGVATRLQNLIAARNSSANAEDLLKSVLGFDQPKEWMTNIETTESYEFQPLSTDLEAAIETALERRPEIRQKRLELELMDHNVKLARNNMLPDLDLAASYGYGGIGGNVRLNDIILEGGPGDAWQQVRDLDFPHWTLGAQFGIPIGNNEAQGRLAQRRFEHQQTQIELAALQQRIIRDVRVAVRALADGAAQVEASLAARDLAERNLEAEQTKFANGLSTNYQVLQIQEDLAVAQLSLIRAYLSYRKAMVGYRVATGTLLDFLDVDIVDPGSPDIPHDYWKDVKWLQSWGVGEASEGVTQPAEPVSN